MTDVNTAYHYGLYPTEEQEFLFHKTFGCTVNLVGGTLLSLTAEYVSQRRECVPAVIHHPGIGRIPAEIRYSNGSGRCRQILYFTRCETRNKEIPSVPTNSLYRPQIREKTICLRKKPKKTGKKMDFGCRKSK